MKSEYPKMILRTTQERLQDLHEWISEKEGMPLTQETITELMQNIIEELLRYHSLSYITKI